MVMRLKAPPPKRPWLLFFSDDGDGHWWSRALAPGFRHVSAVSWYGDQERWVHVNPTASGLVVELFGETEIDGRLGQLTEDASLILRVMSQPHRHSMPVMSGWCVGIVKALLGVRSRALLPKTLARHLLAAGAETVEKPAGESPQAAPGRPEGRGNATAGA